MAKAVYTTVDGDRLDQICAIHYAGRQKRVVEAVFDANPHLVSLGVYYDAGIEIALPSLDLNNEVLTINPWS